MIPAKINIYEKTTKRKNRSGENKSYSSKQYVIRLRCKDIGNETLKQFKDKDTVIVLTSKEYDDLIYTKSSLEKKFLDLKFHHELEINKLNNKLKSKEKIIENLNSNKDKSRSNWFNKLFGKAI